MVRATRLPVGGLVAATFRDLGSNLGGLARIGWAWYAAALGADVAGRWLAGTALDGFGGPVDVVAGGLGDIAAGLVTGFAVPACSVPWQRRLLLGEPLRRVARLDRRAGRYLLWGLLASLVACLPLAGAGALGLAGAAAAWSDGGEAWMSAMGLAALPLGGAAVAGGLTLFVRLGLVLPAVSVDGPVSLRRSWTATRGNGWRLVAAFLLLVLALLPVGVALTFVEDLPGGGAADGDSATALAGAALNAAYGLVAPLLYAGLAALAYRHLEPGAAATAGASAAARRP